MLSQALNRAMPHSRNQLEEGVNRKEIIFLFSCSTVVHIEAVNLCPYCSLEQCASFYLSWNFICNNIAILVIWRITSVRFDDRVVKFNINRIF